MLNAKERRTYLEASRNGSTEVQFDYLSLFAEYGSQLELRNSIAYVGDKQLMLYGMTVKVRDCEVWK